MPDRFTFAECDNCGKRGQYTLEGKKRALPKDWVTINNTIVGTAIFHDETCRDAWTSSRNWQRNEEVMAVQELAKLSGA